MKKLITIFCCIVLLTLTGCTRYNLLILNTQKEDIVEQLNNYVPLTSSKRIGQDIYGKAIKENTERMINYRDDNAGLYRISERSTTSGYWTKEYYRDKHNKQRERTVYNPESTSVIYYILKISQLDDDVLIEPLCDNSDDGNSPNIGAFEVADDVILKGCTTTSTDDFIKSLDKNGYTAFKVKTDN